MHGFRVSLSAVAAAALLASAYASPSAASTITASYSLPSASIGKIGTAVGYDFPEPFSIGQGQTLDLTYSFDKVTLTGDSFIWGLAFATDGGASMDVSGTVEFLGAGGDIVSGPISINQNNSAAHIGIYLFPADYRTGSGSISFTGIRQILTVTGGFTYGPDNGELPLQQRTFTRGFLWTDGVKGSGGGGGNPGVIPEPATWAMMIAGFGLVGGAMRRRREVLAA